MPSSGPILSVSYTLQPPQSTSTPPTLSPTTTHQFPLRLTSNSSLPGQSENRDGDTSEPESAVPKQSCHHDYYVALREAISEAKVVTGRELTEWRDAVGDGEKDKTGGKEERGEVEVDEEGEEESEEKEEEEKEEDRRETRLKWRNNKKNW